MNAKPAKVFVKELGIDRKGSVILLHGFGVDHRIWYPAIAPLLHRYKFILPDFRGFGKSSQLAFQDPCAIASYADDIEEIVNDRGIEDVFLGGFSLGGLVSMELLKRGKLKVRRYLNVDQSPKPLSCDLWPYGLGGDTLGQDFVERAKRILSEIEAHPEPENFASLSKELKRSIYESFSLFLQTAVSGSTQKYLSPLIFQTPYLRENLSIFKSWKVTLQIMKCYIENDYDYRSTLGSLEIPVTYLVGAVSEIYPPAGQEITHAMTPTSRIVAFEKSGHDLMLKQPIKFAREMKDFLNFESSI